MKFGKQVFCVLLAVLVLTVSLTVSVAAVNITLGETVVTDDGECGDVNEDGAVDNKDLGLLARYLNGHAVTLNEDAADVNADGAVDNKDFGQLTRYLNGWDVTLG